MTDKCYYKIGFNNWYQTELTWKQDKKIAGLFNKLRSIADPGDELDFSIDGIIKVLQHYDLLKTFLKILLSPVKDWRYWLFLGLRSPDADRLTNSGIAEIATDFFLLNQKFMTKLKPLEKALTLISKAAEKQTRKTSRSKKNIGEKTN